MGIRLYDVTSKYCGLKAVSLVSSQDYTLPTGAPASNGFLTSNNAGALSWTLASTIATTAYVDAAVVGLLDFKGSTDCSTNPNFPAASKGDSYVVSVAGRIGGVSGPVVAVGDFYFAVADNAGGTNASVGSSWDILEKNLDGALLTANNLSELTGTASTARTNLGLGTSAVKNTGTSGNNIPLLDGANTHSGLNTFSNSAATSAAGVRFTGLPFAGDGTTSYPVVYINATGSTQPTTLHGSGSMLAINGATGVGRLIDCHTNGGASLFSVTSAGDTTASGNIMGAALISTGNVQLAGSLRVTNSTTPATAGATGTVGTIAWDGTYFYVCTATNTWRRVAHASW